jgi:hypothetical protein
MSYTFTNLKFQKEDRFSNPVFIAAESTDPENCAKLKNIHEKLVEREYETFLPVYHSEEYSYATLRLKKNYKIPKFTEGATYNLDVEIRTNVKDSKTYVNVHLIKARLNTKVARESKGELLEL